MSSGFEDLCERQLQLIAEVRGLDGKFLKNSYPRRTEKVRNSYLIQLNELWSEFQSNHKGILSHPQVDKSHLYFLNNNYQTGSRWFIKARAGIQPEAKFFRDTKVSSFVEIPPKNLLTMSDHGGGEPPAGRPGNNDAPQRENGHQIGGDDPQELAEPEVPDHLKPILRNQQFLGSLIRRLSEEILSGTITPSLLKVKITRLNQKWEEFERGHQTLLAENLDPNHGYLANDMYTQLEIAYEDAAAAAQESTDESRVLSSTTGPLSTSRSSGFAVTTAQRIIPDFRGNPRELHKFLTCADDIYECVSTADDRLTFFSIIRSKLFGEAYDLLRGGQLTSWPALKEALISRFEQRVSRHSLIMQLGNAVQKGNETVKEYVQRITLLLSELNDASVHANNWQLTESLQRDNEAQAVRTFEDGLRDPQLQMLAKVYADKRLVSITKHILEHSSRLTERSRTDEKSRPQPRPGVYNVPICFRCNQPGHLSTNCPNLPQQSRNPPRIEPLRPGLGRSPICNYCKRAGHTINECQTRARNNELNRARLPDFSPRRDTDPGASQNVRHVSFETNAPGSGQPIPSNLEGITPPQAPETEARALTSAQGNAIGRRTLVGHPSSVQIRADVHRQPSPRR